MGFLTDINIFNTLYMRACGKFCKRRQRFERTKSVMEGNMNMNPIAPFVLKTYQMVSYASTDSLIQWGRANNSFIVIEPLDFSQKLLPTYFKHNNFSSFVRQLNTYGFRKVDPDKWEFANEWFLRGQVQLLNNITRRKNHRSSSNCLLLSSKEFDEEEEILKMEVVRLKQEQKSLDEELQGMEKRLQATEKRPQQMMTFLSKVVEDPNILPRMMLETQTKRRLLLGEKKRRLMIPPLLPSSSTPSPTDTAATTTTSDSRIVADQLFDASTPSSNGIDVNSPSFIGYSNQMVFYPEARSHSNYPFSLLEGGF